MRTHSLAFVLANIATAVLGVACSSVFPNSSCPGPYPDPKSVDVSPELACKAIVDLYPGRELSEVNVDCVAAGCGAEYNSCVLDKDYVARAKAAQPDAAAPVADAGDGGDAGVADPGPTVRACPPQTARVGVRCATYCEGRRTEGLADVDAPADASVGQYFAACAYLEAGSVFAFQRLGSELRAHLAPPALLDAVSRAEADEVVHTELTANLARTFGVEPVMPRAPLTSQRSLFDVALENVVEGCIRETYGAALALVRAGRSGDPSVRAAMHRIATDECAHAELSFEVAAWLDERLDDTGRETIREAARAAIEDLRRDIDESAVGDDLVRVAGMATRGERKSLVALLERDVFGALFVEDDGLRERSL